jgi:D-isomer specific 2-hydroxyacid dehydrogenase, NAD binding domain
MWQRTGPARAQQAEQEATAATRKPNGKHDQRRLLAHRRANTTIAHAIDDYLQDHAGGNHSDKTLEWHRTALGLMQGYLERERGITLVNSARGSLIDEEALLAALNEGRLAGVALDVFSQEPIGDNAMLRQLLSHERVIATPHLGASTVEAQVRVATEVARTIISALRGDTLYGIATLPFPPTKPA